MPGADVRLMKRDDPGPLFPEVVEAGFMEILPESTWKVALIEGGMASGKPAVALAIPTPDGRPENYVIVQTSLEMLTMILGAARGAFPDFFRGGQFDPTDQEAMALQIAEAFVIVAQGIETMTGMDPHALAHHLLDQVKASAPEIDEETKARIRDNLERGG